MSNVLTDAKTEFSYRSDEYLIAVSCAIRAIVDAENSLVETGPSILTGSNPSVIMGVALGFFNAFIYSLSGEDVEHGATTVIIADITKSYARDLSDTFIMERPQFAAVDIAAKTRKWLVKKIESYRRYPCPFKSDATMILQLAQAELARRDTVCHLDDFEWAFKTITKVSTELQYDDPDEYPVYPSDVMNNNDDFDDDDDDDVDDVDDDVLDMMLLKDTLKSLKERSRELTELRRSGLHNAPTTDIEGGSTVQDTSQLLKQIAELNYEFEKMMISHRESIHAWKESVYRLVPEAE